MQIYDERSKTSKEKNKMFSLGEKGGSRKCNGAKFCNKNINEIPEAK
jgi:hypothetical protein